MEATAPYYIYPLVMALRKGVDDPQEAERMRRIVAANVGDTRALRIMLGIDPEEFANFYPDMATPELSTVDTIDSFLDRFGRPDAPLPQAAAEIPVEIAPPAPTQTPPGTPSQPDPSHLTGTHLPQPDPSHLTGAHLPQPDPSFSSSPRFTEEASYSERNESERAQKPLPTEQEARILIKNRDYQAALEIIQLLNLNIPEKSIYFADQIRFLKKLISNEARKKQQKG